MSMYYPSPVPVSSYPHRLPQIDQLHFGNATNRPPNPHPAPHPPVIPSLSSFRMDPPPMVNVNAVSFSQGGGAVGVSSSTSASVSSHPPTSYFPPPPPFLHPQALIDSRLSAFRPVGSGLTLSEDALPTFPSLPISTHTNFSGGRGERDGSSESLVKTLKTFLLPPNKATPPSTTSSIENKSSNGSPEEMNPGMVDGRLSVESGNQRRDHHQDNTSCLVGQTSFDGTTVLCQVCGDKASGFHYGVHACEGCKGFFRRSIQQKIQYRPCTKNQQCSILRINRNRCQYCRLKKCIAVGMSRDAVRFGRVPKREKAKILAEMQKANAKSQVDSIAAELEDVERLIGSVVTAHLHTCEFTREKLLPLLAQYRQRGLPRLTSLIACPLNPISPDGRNGEGEELSEKYSPAIRGVVDFAKSIPGFHVLSQEDQVTLLKAGMFEILLLRLTVLFDSDNKSMMLLDGRIFKREGCPLGGGRFLVDSLFDFVERFNALALNDADIALYCAIVLISPDRPGVRNKELVEKMQERFKEGLRKVLLHHHPNEPSLFNQLIMKIPDLRTLNTLHQEKLLVFKVDAVLEKDGLKPKSSPSASSRSRSPQSDGGDNRIKHVAPMEVPSRASHWSLTCKASDSSPSISPAQNNSNSGGSGSGGGGSRGSAEAAHFHTLRISPSQHPQMKIEGAWPSREASSFDSGKGTLSAKVSSCSDSDGEERLIDSPNHPHQVQTKAGNMPTLKRALQAPPIPTPADPAGSNSRLREKHRAVASLLERRPSHTLSTHSSSSGGHGESSSASSTSLSTLWPFPQHAAAFWLSSRAAALGSPPTNGLLAPVPQVGKNLRHQLPSPPKIKVERVNRMSEERDLRERDLRLMEEKMKYRPMTAAISPAHAHSLPISQHSSPDEDEQPLNLCTKPHPQSL